MAGAADWADWADWAIWVIVGGTAGAICLRPFGWPGWCSALGGAALLVLSGLLPLRAALRGVAQGGDVYLFLTGMMMLAALAADAGVFAWAASHTARAARGSGKKLFLLVYGLAVLVTVFLSNDATAILFTPAVAAMAEAACVARPLPYLLICAFVANAASFVLPISNPANLVVYGASLPALGPWLRQFGPAACLAILATFVALRMTQSAALPARIRSDIPLPALSVAGRLTGLALVAAVPVLLTASALHMPLGAPAFLTGLAALLLVSACSRRSPWPVLNDMSWGVLALVAGLFVLVAALDRVQAVAALGRVLAAAGAWGGGLGVGLVSNLVNNLPAGLLAGQALATVNAAHGLPAAVLVGVDLGPNLSITGSLATLLWLDALRRAGIDMTGARFVRLGLVVMPAALLAALAALLARRG